MTSIALESGAEFQTVKYWSSTAHDGGTSAWQRNFNTGDVNNEGKGSSFKVRAVRRF